MGIIQISPKQGRKTAQHFQNIAPEIKENRHQGADMHGKIKDQVIPPRIGTVPVSEQGMGQQQVAAGADGKKFGNPLNQGKNGNMKKWHESNFYP